MRGVILGEYIRYERKKRHMSLKQMSSLCGVSVAQLSRIERSVCNNKEVMPSIDTLERIANALQVSLETLLAVSGFIGEQPDKSELYFQVEEFLKGNEIRPIHNLPIESFGVIEKQILFDYIIQSIEVISYKYK